MLKLYIGAPITMTSAAKTSPINLSESRRAVSSGAVLATARTPATVSGVR
jgi:hypothetical protein